MGRTAVAAVIARHDWAGPLAKVLRGLWTDAYAVGWLSSGAVLAHHLGVTKADAPVATVTLGVDWGGWSPGDTDAAKQILGRDDALGHLLSLVDTGDQVADSIVVSRMDRLARTLIDGLEQGLAPATIATQLQGILGDARWAHLVALTETTRAVSAATLARYARNGVAAKEWMTAGDQHVCVPCNTNEDVGAIPLEQAFPDGTDAPPGHPLCRCAIAPAWLTAEEAAAAGGDLTGLLPASGEADLAGIVARAAEDILAEAGEGVSAAAAEASGGAAAVQPVAVEVRPALEAARTTGAVERAFEAEAARITGRTAWSDRIRASFSGSAATAREHAEGLLRGLERFPDANLRYVGSTSNVPEYAHAAGDTIRFNYEFTKPAARKMYLDTLAKDVAGWDKGIQEFGVGEFKVSSWHPRGTGNPVAVALHEFGHVIDIATTAERARPAIDELLERRTEEAMRLSRPAGETPITGTRDLILREISGYALKSDYELAAEAFADVMINGEAASALSRDVFAILEREYAAGGARLGAENPLATVPMRATAAPSELSRMTVKQLRELAMSEGVPSYEVAFAKKPDVIRFIEQFRADRLTVSEAAQLRIGQLLSGFDIDFGRGYVNEAYGRWLDTQLAGLSKDLPADVLANLKSAAATGERPSIGPALRALAQRTGVRNLAEVSDIVPYNPALHELPAGVTREAGQLIQVARPGVETVQGSVLERAQVAIPHAETLGEVMGRALEVRPELAEASTLDEVTAAAEQQAQLLGVRGGARFDSDPSWSVETYREHVEGILRVMERYPDSGFSQIVVLRRDPGDSFFARTGFTRTMEFHPDYVKPGDREKYLEKIRWNQASHFTAGAANPIAIALHEMGHVIDYDIYSAATPKIERLVATNARKLGLTEKRYIEHEVSHYAASDTAELIGEAFADVMIRGEAASPLSQQVVKLLDEAYNKTGLRRMVGPAIEPKPDFASMPLADLRAKVAEAGIEVPVGATRAQLAQALYDPGQAQYAVVRVASERSKALIGLDAALAGTPTAEQISAAIEAIDAGRAGLTGADLSALRRAAADPAKLQAAVDRMLAKYKIETYGGNVGEIVPYESSTMTMSGNAAMRVQPGDLVRVASRGTRITVNGEPRNLTYTTVRPVPKTELRAAARERNRLIEAATGTERLLASIDELLAKRASIDVIRENLVAGLTEPGQVFSGADAKVLAALQRAADTGDVAKVRAAVTRQSTAAKLKIEAKAGTKLTFDPATMESIGGVDIVPGTPVVVVRRGASVTLPDGTVLELTKPQVRTLPKPVRRPRTR